MITDDAVYSDKLVIHAPAAFVWDILVDFSHYGDWNSFCPEANARLEIGAAVAMRVDLGQGLQDQLEHIELIDPPRAIAWSMTLENRQTLYACRTQTLEAINDQRCSYLSVDRFAGRLAGAVLAGNGAAIERGFNTCAQDLKRHAEARYARQSAR